MKKYNRFFGIVIMILMCFTLFGCGVYENNEEICLRISDSIVKYISSNDYDSFTSLFSEEAKEYLHSSLEEYHFSRAIFGEKLEVCDSKIYGGLKQLGINKYESFDAECLIKDNDNNYYLIFYTYCKVNKDDSKSKGIKIIIIVNSNEKGTLFDEYVDSFDHLDEYGFYPNI